MSGIRGGAAQPLGGGSGGSQVLPGLNSLSLTQGFEKFTHCMEDIPLFMSVNSSNAENSNINPFEGDEHPGQWRMRILDNATAYSNFQQASNAGLYPIELGGGSWRYEILVNLAQLSTAANEFILTAGFIDARNNDAINNGVYLEYDRTNSTNWIGVTESGGTRTEVDSGEAVATGTGNWTTLRFDINAAGTEVEFFINGTSVGTSSTNIPSAGLQYHFKVAKSASNTANTFFFIDYLYIRNQLTTTI